MNTEEYLEFQKKSEELAEKLKNFAHRLDAAISINKLQKNRLIELEEGLMSLIAERRLMERQLSKKRFSLRSLFKRD